MYFQEYNAYSTGCTVVPSYGTWSGWGGYELYTQSLGPAAYVQYPGLAAAIGQSFTISYGWTQNSNHAPFAKITITDGTNVIFTHIFDETQDSAAWAIANGFTYQNYTDPTYGAANFVNFLTATAATNAFTVRIEKGGGTANDGQYVTADFLLYSSSSPIPKPAAVYDVIVGPAGKSLILLVGDLSHVPSAVTGVTSQPSISVNGGASTALANPIWGVSHSYPYIIYPLTGSSGVLGAPLAPTDVVTVTAVDSWATAAVGPLGAMTSVPARHTSGTILPFVPSRKTMRIGYNVNWANLNEPVIIFSDLARQSGVWGGDVTVNSVGYPTACNSGYGVYVGINGPADNPVGGNSGLYRSSPDGVYTVQWLSTTKDYTVHFSSAGGCTVSTTPTITTLPDGRTRLQQSCVATVPGGLNLLLYVTKPVDIVNDPLGLLGRVASFPIDMTQLQCFPPGVDPDNPPLFTPWFLSLIDGAKCLRFMDALGTNSSSVVDFSDFILPYSKTSPDRLSGGDALLVLTIPIVELSPYDNADSYFHMAGQVGMLIRVDFASPHGLKEAQFCQIGNLIGPNGDGTFPVSGGIWTGTPAQNGGHTTGSSLASGTTLQLNNSQFLVHVLSATAIAFLGPGIGWCINMSFGGTFTSGLGAGSYVFTSVKQYMAPAECISLCNATGADAWLNIPHGATDACVMTFCNLVATSLSPGLRCHLEYSNETWNYAAGFYQYSYCVNNGQLLTTGSGLAMSLAIDAYGKVVPTITNGGTNYAQGVGVPITFTGGTLAGGAPAWGWLQASLGAVTGVHLADPGNYSSAPTGFTLFGTGLAMTMALDGGGNVVPTITNGGIGYRTSSTITFTGGVLNDGTAVTATTYSTNGVVTSLSLVANGHYTAGNPPTGFTVSPNTMDFDNWYVWRMGQVHIMARAAFASAGRTTDLVRVLATQGSWSGNINGRVTDAVAFGWDFEECAGAPYFWNGPYESSLATVFDTLDNDQVMDLMETYMGYSLDVNNFVSNITNALNTFYPRAVPVCYEGGPEMLGLTSNSGTVGGARSRMTARHPRMRWVMFRYLQILQSYGYTLFNDYMLSGNIRSNVYWAAAMWACYVRYDQPAGMGDGSDGLYDNRLNYENIDEGGIVSVVGGAINRWNKLTRAGYNPYLSRGRQLYRCRS